MRAVTPDRAEEAPSGLGGQLIGGRFRLGRLIGRGGMGEVREAEHIELGRRVAVKIMHGRAAAQRSSIGRIKREARSLAALSHPHIVEVLDAGEHEGTPFLVMELLEGEDLRTRIDRLGPLPLGEALAITSQMLAGLDAVHAAGIVHRDVKPENVFLTRQPDGAVFVKILDFGVSKLMDLDSAAGNLTESGTIVGSPAFMAPEQAIGSSGIDARTDLYSVGAVLYTMLSGRPPFVAPNIPAVLLAIVEGRAEPLAGLRPALPAALVELVERAMDKERGKRFKNAREFAAALEAFAPTGVHLAAVPRRAWRRAWPLLVLGIAGLGAVTLGLRSRSAPPVRRTPHAESFTAAVPEARAPEAPPGSTPPVSRARLRLVIRPARAAVSAEATLDGRLLIGSEATVDASARPRTLALRAAGYTAREVTIVLDRDREITVTLDPEGPRPRTAPEIYRGPIKLQKERPF